MIKINNSKYKLILLLIFVITLIWSAIHPKDYFTWALEVFPAIVGLVFLTVTKHKVTNLLLLLILIHSIILMIGGHYTYAEVPLFDYFKEVFNTTRNNYDKVGHFAQGFIPAIITREILLNKNVISNRKWLNFFIIVTCMALSVTYEFLEWFVAIFSGESAEAFLGTQGYIWDTQSDMLYATIGASISLIILSKVHDKQLQLL